jgi:hypothetical protein
MWDFYSCRLRGIMKNIISGCFILTILLIGGVFAEDTNDNQTIGEPWMLNNESAHAMIELYAADLRMIEDGFGSLILKDASEVEDFMIATQDPDGKIDALLDTIDAAVNESEEATAEWATLYSAYDALNASGLQMLSTFEAHNLTPAEDEVVEYKDAAVDLIRVFDNIIARFIDKNAIGEDSFRLLLYTHLLGAVNAQEGYVLTADPALIDLYTEKMSAFDTDAALFESRFAESSIEDIRELKQKADGVVQESMTNMTENGSEADMSALIPVVIEIMDGYKETTTL